MVNENNPDQAHGIAPATYMGQKSPFFHFSGVFDASRLWFSSTTVAKAPIPMCRQSDHAPQSRYATVLFVQFFDLFPPPACYISPCRSASAATCRVHYTGFFARSSGATRRSRPRRYVRRNASNGALVCVMTPALRCLAQSTVVSA